MNKIDEFVKWLPSKSAKKYYRIYLEKYFEFIKADPDKYFDPNRDYTNDVREFSVHLQDNYAPGSQKIILSVLRNFLLENDVQLKPRIWKQIRIRNNLEGDLTIVEEKVPDNSELKQILQHGTIKEQALFLTNATSGERIDETLSLTFDNIQDRHITIQYHDTKKRYKRHTFITLEAREKLDAWLKVRPEYIKRKFAKSGYVRKQYADKGYNVKVEKIKDAHGKIVERIWHIFKDGKELDFEDFIEIIAEEDKRIFPFEYSTAIRMWNRMLEEAGKPFNEKDKNPQLKNPHYKYHIHTLRKFMKTQM
ncbi:MAG: site-specific integrase, partial [Thermoplasmatales archaeon]|nr:site-specific integrase [Thermoplasmatales archaeon]